MEMRIGFFELLPCSKKDVKCTFNVLPIGKECVRYTIYEEAVENALRILENDLG